MLITVTIPNWPKYNPRSDRANHSWFRFQNAFFSDQVLFGLTDAQRLLFIFLMCEASRSGSKGQLEIETLYVSGLRMRSNSEIIADIRALAARGRIDVIWPPDGCQDDGEQPPLLHTTNERTDVTKRDVSKKNEIHLVRESAAAEIDAELAQAFDRAKQRNAVLE